MAHKYYENKTLAGKYEKIYCENIKIDVKLDIVNDEPFSLKCSTTSKANISLTLNLYNVTIS